MRHSGSIIKSANKTFYFRYLIDVISIKIRLNRIDFSTAKDNPFLQTGKTMNVGEVSEKAFLNNNVPRSIISLPKKPFWYIMV